MNRKYPANSKVWYFKNNGDYMSALVADLSDKTPANRTVEKGLNLNLTKKYTLH